MKNCNILSPTHQTRRIIQDQHAFIPGCQMLPFAPKSWLHRDVHQECSGLGHVTRRQQQSVFYSASLFSISILKMLWIDSSQSPWLISFFFFALTMLSDENTSGFGTLLHSSRSLLFHHPIKIRWGRTVLAEKPILAVNNQPVTSDLALVT